MKKNTELVKLEISKELADKFRAYVAIKKMEVPIEMLIPQVMWMFLKQEGFDQ